MRPAHLPRTEDDLPHWRVWADHLLHQGDELGEAISLELAIDAAPGAGELKRFRELVGSRCVVSPYLSIGWCLSHARTVRIVVPNQGWAGSWPMRAPTNENFVELDRLLQHPAGVFVEEIETEIAPDQVTRLGKLLSAAPREIQLTLVALGEWFEEELEALTEALPSSLRRIRATDPQSAAALRRRFTVAETRYNGWYDVDQLAPPVERGDAAWIPPNGGWVNLVPRLPLAELGIVPVRAQLKRSMPELHEGWPHHLHGRPPPVTRDAHGRWTREGVEVRTGQLCEGDDGRPWQFLEDAADWPRFCDPVAT